MKEDLLEIINHYGINNQLKYIHSEYFELDEAILKYYENESVGLDEHHIAEEIADVEMMLDQFKAYYEIKQEEIDKIKNFKIERQLKRIEEEK